MAKRKLFFAYGAQMSDVLHETTRLALRRWRPEDRAPMAALNGDAEAMRFFPSTLTAAESDAFIRRMQDRMLADGYAMAPVERKSDGVLVGAIGLLAARFEAHFTPAVEIGWRLARPYWGQGYATEAAKAWLEIGFERHGLDEIVSFTAAVNEPSRRVMERIGMTRDPADDFAHPMVPATSPLRHHVLYRIRRPARPV